jgi:DNA-binding beta-propeller fold protein YncE
MTCHRRARRLCVALAFLGAVLPAWGQSERRHFLYVAVPGSDLDTVHRDISLLAFDIDRQHRFVKRIPIWKGGAEPESVRGITAAGRRLYVSTTRRLAAIDLTTEKVVWENSPGGACCDRIAISPDGSTLYAPAFGKPVWYVVDASRGTLESTVPVVGWPRGTLTSRDGTRAYLSAWESEVLSILDTKTRRIVKEVGPFSGSVCAVALNRKESLAFANVDRLVGFEVGDLQTGLVLDRVAAGEYTPDEVGAFQCASHGIAFAPDERELWVADGVGNRLQVFDATTYPPSWKQAIDVPRQPRWITFGRDGRFAYSSTGDVVDAASKRVGATLEADGTIVESEAMLEVD